MSELEWARRDLVPRLKREIEERRVLIMVGAGVSSAASGASVASWSGLLEDGLNRVAVRKSFSAEELESWQSILRTGRTERSLLSVAETVEDELEKPHQEFRDWLQETTGIPRLVAGNNRNSATGCRKQ